MATKLTIIVVLLSYLCIYLVFGLEDFLYFSTGVLIGTGSLICLIYAYVYDALEKQ